MIAAVCLGTGVFWTHLKTVWPAFSERIATVATNPVSWFVIVMFFFARDRFSLTWLEKVYFGRVETTKKPEPTTSKVADPAPPVVAQAFAQPLAEPKRETEPKKEVPREFVDTTPEYLLSIRRREGLSRVQTDKIIEPYLGKWMKVEGAVSEIYKHTVWIEAGEERLGPTSRYHVMLGIDNEQTPKFHLLELGKQISAIGQIERVHWSEVELDHCELAD